MAAVLEDAQVGASRQHGTRLRSLCVVIPCFNEEATLLATYETLRRTISERVRFQILLVDDGSTDSTWSVIEALARQDSRIRGLRLSRNFGHQNALLAGLLESDADVTISIDADLQDDVLTINTMLEAHARGAEIVLGVRADRSADTLAKRTSASLFYWLLRKMEPQVVAHHADFRLLSRKAIDALRGFQEVNLFLRGIAPRLGFATETVFYDRKPRLAGDSKYGWSTMLHLAWEGITGLSAKPIRYITLLGLSISLLSFVAGAWALWAHFFTGLTVAGWTSIVVSVFILGGLQLLSLGIIGEYLAKVYLEVKKRPRYIVDKRV